MKQPSKRSSTRLRNRSGANASDLRSSGCPKSVANRKNKAADVKPTSEASVVKKKRPPKKTATKKRSGRTLESTFQKGKVVLANNVPIQSSHRTRSDKKISEKQVESSSEDESLLRLKKKNVSEVDVVSSSEDEKQKFYIDSSSEDEIRLKGSNKRKNRTFSIDSSSQSSIISDSDCSIDDDRVNDNLDIQHCLDTRDDFEKNVERSEGEINALNSLDVSKKYFGKQNMLVESFINGIAAVTDKNGKMKWKKMLEAVTNPFYCRRKKLMSSKTIPRCFVILSGKKTLEKIELANQLIVDWQLPLKLIKKSKDKNECPYYKPSSQSSNFRAFLSIMRKSYHWRFKQTDFTGFEGSLNATMSTVFEERFEKWVSLHFDFN